MRLRNAFRRQRSFAARNRWLATQRCGSAVQQASMLSRLRKTIWRPYWSAAATTVGGLSLLAVARTCW